MSPYIQVQDWRYLTSFPLYSCHPESTNDWGQGLGQAFYQLFSGELCMYGDTDIVMYWSLAMSYVESRT